MAPLAPAWSSPTPEGPALDTKLVIPFHFSIDNTSQPESEKEFLELCTETSIAKLYEKEEIVCLGNQLLRPSKRVQVHLECLGEHAEGKVKFEKGNGILNKSKVTVTCTFTTTRESRTALKYKVADYQRKRNKFLGIERSSKTKATIRQSEAKFTNEPSAAKSVVCNYELPKEDKGYYWMEDVNVEVVAEAMKKLGNTLLNCAHLENMTVAIQVDLEPLESHTANEQAPVAATLPEIEKVAANAAAEVHTEKGEMENHEATHEADKGDTQIVPNNLPADFTFQLPTFDVSFDFTGPHNLLFFPSKLLAIG